jgi:branched-chain amino acid transport system substrate-binding protein
MPKKHFCAGGSRPRAFARPVERRGGELSRESHRLVSRAQPQTNGWLGPLLDPGEIRANVWPAYDNYAPGADAEAQFRKTFAAAGGKVVAADRVPLASPDFAPFIQRIKDARPEAVFVFVPAGTQGIAFMKAAHERGLTEAGIRIIATGDLTEDQQLDAMGDAALGVVTTHHYSAAHASPENDAFKAAFAKVAGAQLRPNFMAVGGYDGMAAIAAVVQRLCPGKIDGDRAMEAFKGLELQSPRGPIRIDPDTRDIVQTVYVRKVEKRGENYYNVEFEEYPAQRDPGK